MANRLYNKQVSPKGYKAGGRAGKMGGGMMKRPMMKEGGNVKRPGGFKSTQQKGNIVKGKLKSQKELKAITDSKKYKDASYDEKNKMLNVATMAMGGRIKKKMGGSLKPVDKSKNPGLAKLPTKVRNKMGYMKDGGSVGKRMKDQDRSYLNKGNKFKKA